MSLKPKVALSQDFLFQLSKLPKNVHSKVMQWAIKFQTDPKSPGINYENILGARDSNLKSVRIDSDWRGIVFKPSSGDVYVLLYVANHDEAYRWAENRKLAVNPVTGAMQMVLVQSTEEAISVAATAEQASVVPANTPPLFAAQQDRELLSLGVPQEMLATVRTIVSDTQLDALQVRLPVEAYEGLFLVAAGTQ